MKYLISESKLNSFIYEYIDNNFYPDMGWHSPEFYQKIAIRDGSVEFNNNAISAFVYVYKTKIGDILNKPKSIVFWPNTKKTLNGLFGDLWPPIFKKWFEDHTGLEVLHLVDTKDSSL